MAQDSVDKGFNSNRFLRLCLFTLFRIFLPWTCRNWHDWYVSAKPRKGKASLQLLGLCLDHLFSLRWREHIDLIHCDNKFVHENLTKHYAFSCLSLNEFLGINDKHHHVDDTGAADNGFHERCVAGAVDERELNELKRVSDPVLGSEPLRNADDESREAEVEGDAAGLGLRVLVEARSRGDRRKGLAQRGLARVDVTQDTQVDVQDLARVFEQVCRRVIYSFD